MIVARFAGAVAVTLMMRARVAARHRSAQRDATGLAGVVLVSPALSIGAAVPPAMRALSGLISQFAPTLPMATLELEALSRDPAVAAAYAADPLNFHGKVPARTGAEMMAAARAALAAAPHWWTPLYIVAGGADRIAAPAGAQAFAAAAAAGAGVTLELVPGGYHEPLNDPGGERETAKIGDWILARAGEAASTRAAGNGAVLAGPVGLASAVAVSVALANPDPLLDPPAPDDESPVDAPRFEIDVQR